MHVVCVGDQDWGKGVSAAQELMTRLARRNHLVLYVNPSRLSTSRTRSKRVEVQAQLHVVTLPDAGHSRTLQRSLQRTAREVGLRGAVGLSFRDGGESLLAASSTAVVTCGPTEWDTHADGWTWDEAADALIRRLQEAEDSAPNRRGGHRWLAARGPHNRFVRRRATLSRRAHVAFAASVAAGWIYYGARLCWRTLTCGRPHAINRILVARPRCHLGDLIVLLPMLVALRRRFPHARIVLASQPGMPATKLLESTGCVDEIRVIDHLEPITPGSSSPSRSARLSGAIRLFAEGYDVVISGATYFLQREPFFGGAPRRIGFDEGHPLQALNSRVIPLDTSRHEAETNLRLAELVGASLPAAERAPRLPADPQTPGTFARLRDTLHLPPGAPVLTVHPGSKMLSRRWPADRFARVVSALLEERPDLHVVFSGMPGEAALVDHILAMIAAPVRGRAVSAAGQTDLTGLIALLEHSAAVLCNDTGTMHLARALGTPLVALMGPENHMRWGPYPAGDAPAQLLRHEVPCAPCRRQECEPLYCLRSLAVDDVLDAARAVLDRSSAETTVQVRLQRHSWQALAAAGFELPSITVVAFTGRMRRGSAEAGASRGAEQIEAALREQDYPKWSVATASHDSPLDAFRQAFHLTSGALVLPLLAPPDWAHSRLSDDVAVLVRDPYALASADGRPRDAFPSFDNDLAPLHGVLLRRETLLDRLAAPAAPARRHAPDSDWEPAPVAP